MYFLKPYLHNTELLGEGHLERVSEFSCDFSVESLSTTSQPPGEGEGKKRKEKRKEGEGIQ